MKKLFVLSFVFLMANVYAGTCTSISRSNYAANSVLTSTSLNAQLNTAYNNQNAYDLGCGTDGTLEQGALNSSADHFGALLNGIMQGCKVTYATAATLNIEDCNAGVNGKLIQTATNTTVAWTALDAGAESASTLYYVYIQTGSTGSTLTPEISATGPSSDGYNSAGDKILARFYNDASSSIEQYSIDQWHTNGFAAQNQGWTAFTPSFTGFGTATNIVCYFRRVGEDLELRLRFTVGTSTAVEARIALPSGLTSSSGIGTLEVAGFGHRDTSNYAREHVMLIEPSVAYVTFGAADGSNVGLAKKNANSVFSSGETYSFIGKIKVIGWNN